MVEDMGERANEWVEDAKGTMNGMVDRGKTMVG
jgi:hypothetical protein